MSDGVEALRVSARRLARAVAAAMVLMFSAVALPWLLRMIETDLARLAWTLTAFAACHAALMIAIDGVQSLAVMRRLLYAVPILGAGFMAVLWQFGGGVEHPALALAMVLPVIAAAALPRPSFAFEVAIYSILAVVLTTVIASADFLWYLVQLGLPAGALGGTEELLTTVPFPGATTTPAAVFVTVLTFAAMQLAAAFFTTRMARFVRLREELAVRVDEHRGDTLLARALEAAPAPSVIVVAATGQILHASKRFRQQMLLHHDPVIGRELQGVLTFDDPGAFRRLLDDGGEMPRCRYRIGPEERLARVVAGRFEHDGIVYASVVIDDYSDGVATSIAVALLLALLPGSAARAQDALSIAVNADRLDGGNGGGASLLWIHPHASDTFAAGATFLSLAGTRWAFATAGASHRISTRWTVTGEANAGAGTDAQGRFPYLLLRAGGARAWQRHSAEAEWLQVDVARRQSGIVRLGGTLQPMPRLTVRASVFRSLFGDDDVTFGTARGDYDFARVTAIAGLSAGRSVPALLQQPAAADGRVREIFGGIGFGPPAQRWMLLVSSRAGHQRLTVVSRLPLR